MFEFMTVRELYEMVMSGAEFETESLEYVESNCLSEGNFRRL